MKGKVITIEGGDRVGKHTQSILLSQYLCSIGIDTITLSFPNYGTKQASPVENYLAGEILNANGMEASLLYAFDRSITCREANIKKLIDDGIWVIFDRFTPSNQMYQCARELPDNVDLNKSLPINWKMADDIEKLEYDILGLPKPDHIIFLALSRKNNDILLEKDLGKDGGDIHENDHNLLDRAAAVGFELAKKYHWETIHCDSEDGGIQSIDVIHNMIRDLLSTDIEKESKCTNMNQI